MSRVRMQEKAGGEGSGQITEGLLNHGRNVKFSNDSFLLCCKFHPGTPRTRVTSTQQGNADLLASWAGGPHGEQTGGITELRLSCSNGVSSGGGEQERRREAMAEDGERRPGCRKRGSRAQGHGRHQEVSASGKELSS